VTRLSILALAIACAGCRPTQLAGDSLGEFFVTGTLEESTCGAGYPVRSTFTFLVDVRIEEGSSYGYWKLSDGPAVAGSVRDDGTFRFEAATQVVAIEADPATGTTGCALDHTDVVAGEIADDADAGHALTGYEVLDVVPVAGTQCSPLLTLWGGTFPELPCRVEFAFTGERQL
jgi:hypothetical protein